MTAVVKNQMMQEQDAWQNSLDYYKHKNSVLKYRLSEMVDEVEGNQFLQIAEHFQNEFLARDETLKKLSLNLRSMVNAFQKNRNDGWLSKSENMAEHELFRQKLLQFQEEFDLMCKRFDEKISAGFSG